MHDGCFSLVGLKVQETIIAAGNRQADDVLKNQDAMKKAFDAGSTLITNA